MILQASLRAVTRRRTHPGGPRCDRCIRHRSPADGSRRVPPRRSPEAARGIDPAPAGLRGEPAPTCSTPPGPRDPQRYRAIVEAVAPNPSTSWSARTWASGSRTSPSWACAASASGRRSPAGRGRGSRGRRRESQGGQLRRFRRPPAVSRSSTASSVPSETPGRLRKTGRDPIRDPPPAVRAGKRQRTPKTRARAGATVWAGYVPKGGSP